jgi:hypothetical protein
VWDVYLGMREVAWARRGANAVCEAHGSVGAGLEACFAQIGKHRARWVAPRVRVWLSGALARPFLCGPVAGLTSGPR